MKRIKAAAVQIAPDLTSATGTVDRVCDAIDRAAAQGVELAVFPETFVPYYPYFSFVEPAVSMGKAHLRLYELAPTVPGPVAEHLSKTAAQYGMVLVVGVNERDGGTLYNTQLIFDTDGDAAAEAPQDHADLSRAYGLGAGRRLRPARGRHRSRSRRRARVLGALQPARALRADGGRRRNSRARMFPGSHGPGRFSPIKSRSRSGITRWSRAASSVNATGWLTDEQIAGITPDDKLRARAARRLLTPPSSRRRACRFARRSPKAKGMAIAELDPALITNANG